MGAISIIQNAVMRLGEDGVGPLVAGLLIIVLLILLLCHLLETYIKDRNR